MGRIRPVAPLCEDFESGIAGRGKKQIKHCPRCTALTHFFRTGIVNRWNMLSSGNVEVNAVKNFRVELDGKLDRIGQDVRTNEL